LKFVNYTVILVFTGLLIFASLSLPPRGGSDRAADREIGLAGAPNPPAYYIENAYRDAHTDNMVTVILADYRGYDTLGEETVILTAGLVCFLLLREKKKKNEDL